MPSFLPASARTTSRVMMFVDGENLAIRYKARLGNESPRSHVIYEPNVFVWSRFASRIQAPQEYVRRYFYTSAAGDQQHRSQLEGRLRELGIEAPRVFPRTKNKGSKRVDISLTTDMLSHAHRKNYDIAVLVAGDEDYVPLVEAVQAEGRRVALWFLENGLSPALRAVADHYWNLEELFFDGPESNPAFVTIYSLL